MPSKEYRIEILKERIDYLRKLYDELESSNTPEFILGMIVNKILELKERIRKLEVKN